MNKVICWLTGGHRYSAMNLKSSYNHYTGQSILANRCVKCGKKITVTIDVDEIIKKDMEEFEKRRISYVIKDGEDNAVD